MKFRPLTAGDDAGVGYLKLLPPKARRGSKARCHLLTHGPANEVAGRLTSLVEPWGRVDPNDHWMPQGFKNVEEAQLAKPSDLMDKEISGSLLSWWLANPSSRANTPNWDIASTCTIDSKKGLLLVEAKAHDQELRFEESGKILEPSASANARQNHDRICACIREASLGLTRETGLQCELSRDRNYQMSNRFAWAWKLTQLEIPVILVYLGILNADEMKDRGKPFASDAEWQRLVRMHSEPLFPPAIWNRKWELSGRAFIVLIKTVKCLLRGSSRNLNLRDDATNGEQRRICIPKDKLMPRHYSRHFSKVRDLFLQHSTTSEELLKSLYEEFDSIVTNGVRYEGRDVFIDRDEKAQEFADQPVHREERLTYQLYRLAHERADGSILVGCDQVWLVTFEVPNRAKHRKSRADLLGIGEDGSLVVFECKLQGNAEDPLDGILQGLGYLAQLLVEENLTKLVSGFERWRQKKDRWTKAPPAHVKFSRRAVHSVLLLAPMEYYERHSRTKESDWMKLSSRCWPLPPGRFALDFAVTEQFRAEPCVLFPTQAQAPNHIR